MATDPFAAKLRQRLDDIDQRQLRRVLRQRQSPQTARVVVDGEQKLNFCSNDYLGLANDERIRQALERGLSEYGVGSGASPLVCGYTQAQAELEQALAEFTGRDRTLLFNAGFQMNSTVVSALLDRSAAVFSDALNHASLIDGIRLSRSQLNVFPHGDMAALEQALSKSDAEQKLIVSDAVFSMDGDVAQLPSLARLGAEHQAWLLVDDAHGLGVLGPQGRGAVAEAALAQADVQLLAGTFGKSFGMSGAFVAGSDLAIESLLQRSRGLIFSTAAPPALAVALRESLRVVEAADERREHLQKLITRLGQGLSQLGLTDANQLSRTPIQPLVLGSEARALAVSASLWRRGFWVGAIRPPTVPKGTARLRITLSAAHSAQQVDQLIEALAASVAEAR